MTANTFGLSAPTVSSVLFEVSKTISAILGPKYIHLPRDYAEMKRKVAEFEGKFGMVQAFGCVDGTHIAVRRPKRPNAVSTQRNLNFSIQTNDGKPNLSNI